MVWFSSRYQIWRKDKRNETEKEIELEKEIDSNGPQTQRLQQERDESTNREREKSNLTTRFKTTRPVDYKSKDTKREKGGEIRLKIILEREREREREIWDSINDGELAKVASWRQQWVGNGGGQVRKARFLVYMPLVVSTNFLKKTYFLILLRDNYTKPTCGMAGFHFAYPWFNHLHFTHLNFNSLSIRYPPLLKSGVKMYFTFTFMFLSSKNKK